MTNGNGWSYIGAWEEWQMDMGGVIEEYGCGDRVLELNS